MSKLNKRCFLASAAMHGLLLLVLLVGPAFFVSRQKAPDLPTLDIIPAKLIDEAFYRQATPAPAPKPPVRERNPEPVEPPKTAPPAKPEPAKWTPSSKIKVSTARVRPTKSSRSTKRPSQAAKIAAQAIRSANASTTITVPRGGSVSYANYAQAVKSIYEERWIPPEETASDNAIATVRIVIARDGTILSAELIGRSGDLSVDASVKDTLRRVTKVRPFPDGATEQTRTYTIGFNLRAKR